jgi:transcriptional regulator with PAS, ATPase and Fis domain
VSRRARADTTIAVEIGRTRLRYRTGKLVILGKGGEAEREYKIDLPHVKIGSHESNSVVLEDQHVSRFHCEIRQTPEGFLIKDLESTNGTLVEGIAVKEAILRSGVTISLGKTRIKFLTDDAEVEVPPSERTSFGDAVGKSAKMREIFGVLERIAPTDLTVTLIGETGTGKDVIARSIHKASPRAKKPFVVFDCGAVAPNLIESELFGHEKGAFTGAVAERAGAFERADGGTLFLDEIGELALDLQPKLLRAIEHRAVRRVGGNDELEVDVRLIAATNKNLEADARQGKFREDLYFRLSVVTLEIPSLRQRRDDMVELGQAILKQLGRADTSIAPETMHILESYDWPGNVRELRNVIESAAAVCDSNLLEPRHLLFFKPRAKHREPSMQALPLAGKTLESIEKAAIQQTLEKFSGNKTQAARALGIAPSTLYEKIKKYGL